MSDLLVQGGRLFDPVSRVDGIGDLLIKDGQVAAVGEAVSVEAEVLGARGLLVVPGLLDMHVHLREPGQEHKETIASGTRAAAMGGFTAVACEPNTSPPRDTAERVAEVIETAKREAAIRVLPKCAITVGQEGSEVTDFAALRAAGAAAASDDGFSVRDAGVMRDALAAAKQTRMPLTLHVDGPEMVERDIGLAAELGWGVHFSHVSLAAEVELIAEARERGLPVSGEATPHHLALCADDAPMGDANFKMNPPLRSAGDRDALRTALVEGVICAIASDHAPHAPDEKARPFEEAPPGVIGLETTVGVIWTDLVHTGLLAERAAVRAMTAGPQEVLGMVGGSVSPALRIGARGDVTLLDPDHEWTVEPERFESKARNCPFAGRRLRGRAVATIVAGRAVMREGSILAPGAIE